MMQAHIMINVSGHDDKLLLQYKAYKTWVLTEISFLYKCIYHRLSIERYLFLIFKTQIGLNILNSKCEWYTSK